MTHEDVVDWKLAAIQGEENTEMSKGMWAYLEQHPELQRELEFIETVYAKHEVEEQTPSAAMDANFYQMLSRAQAQVPSTLRRQNEAQPKEDWWQQFKQWWLSPRPVAQFAALGLVFALGFNVNSGPDVNAEPELASLQQEVSSLNTMLALNLLEKSSASERLSGVAYSRASDLTNPLLQEKLTKLIRTDSSTSVRLAVLNRLAQLQNIQPYADILFELGADNENALMQFSAVRILLGSEDPKIQKQLVELAKRENLNPDIKALILAKNQQTFA